MTFSPDAAVPGLFRAEAGAYATACAFSPNGETLALATGDGKLLLTAPATRETLLTKPHEGAVLCLQATAEGFVSGGDDGRIMRTAENGASEETYRRKGRWIEHLAVCAGGRLAAAMGREVALFEPGTAEPRLLGPLRSSVAGLRSGLGGRLLAATHNDGLTLWDLPPSSPEGRLLEAQGSHLSLALSADGRFAACATQDKAVRVFDLRENEGYAMEGYPIKVESLAFDAENRRLLTGGEQAVVAWDILAPEEELGKPITFGAFEHGFARVVAPHPALPLVCAGFDGGVVFLGDVSRRTARPLFTLPGDRVTCLAWSHNGRHLAGGSDSGGLFLLDLVALATA